MKRKTKQQREADLRQRIMDLARGAGHGQSLNGPDGNEGDFYFAMGAGDFLGFIRAVRSEFPEPESTAVYELWQLCQFKNIDTTVAHLIERGVKF